MQQAFYAAEEPLDSPTLVSRTAAGMHFGEHVMIDGYQGSEALLNDRHIILACLEELPAKLSMKALSKPQVYFAEGGSLKDPGGWTGVVVIEESHISIHSFPAYRFVSIDVYTCRNGLSVAAIEVFFREKLGLQVFETQFVKRGQEFGRLALGPYRRLQQHG